MSLIKKKLPALPELISLSDTDLLHINRNNVDYKAQLSLLPTSILVNSDRIIDNTYSSVYTTKTVTVNDDPILATRGRQILSFNYTPNAINNILVINYFANLSFSVSAGRIFLLLAASTETIVLGAVPEWAISVIGAPFSCGGSAIYIAPTTNTITFSLRGAGQTSTAITTNGYSSSRLHGGTTKNGILIEEYAP